MVRIMAMTRGSDRFDWQLWTPDELTATLKAAGWCTLVACRAFDEALDPSLQHPRMQLVAERLTRTSGGDSACREP